MSFSTLLLKSGTVKCIYGAIIEKTYFLGENVGMRLGGVSASVNGSLSFNVAL